MVPEPLPAAERVKILKDRSHHLNLAMTMCIHERLDAIQSTRKALARAQKDLVNGK